MTTLIVLGGTGYAGSNILAAAAARGLRAVSYSRSLPQSPIAGVEYRTGDLADAAVLGSALEGADAVIATLAPRGDLGAPGRLRELYGAIADEAAKKGVRLGVVGGAGSLQVADGGPRLVDTEGFPAEFKGEALELTAVLADLQASDSSLDWFYVSPAAGFGAYAPGEATGSYRAGGDVLLSDAAGESFISGADFGLAVVDEVVAPAHRRVRFTVAY